MTISAEEARAELLALMHAWTVAVGASDEAFFQKHVDAGWRYIDYVGMQRGIADYLVIIQDVSSYVEDFRQFDVRIVAGNIALVTGIYHARVNFQSLGLLEKQLVFSAAWQKRDGVWKALLHHTTELPS